VTSGNSVDTYHMWWTAIAGTFTDMYSPTAIWKAPDYSPGSGISNIAVTAHANDYNRGTDTSGYDDTGRKDWITLRVWQVTVTSSQSGTTSSNYDGPATPASYGGSNLGWVVPGTPAGATSYHGNTELSGSIPSGVPYRNDYRWYNYMKGYYRHKVQGSSSWVYGWNYSDWIPDFDPSYYWTDRDPKHPNGTGPNVGAIFAMDAPGFLAGSTNDNKIAAPDNWRDLEFDMDYRANVSLDGIPVSNYCYWGVDFVLTESNGHWSVVSPGP